ncbi:MAG TPA: S41 family peptidase [Candidatus Paceibacterota bacterium]|nr:S41 family peptidase [Candidatus Paceibacterota bacterium]
MRKIFNKGLVSVLVAVLCLGGTFYAGYATGAHNSARLITGVYNTSNGAQAGVDFSPFWKAWSELNDKFVPTSTTSEAVTDQDKVWGAIAGLTASLGDPYTVFFPPAESSVFEGDISGNFDGVGMEIGTRNDILTVISPLKDTPAYKAGIKSGDQILAIGATSTAGMSSDEAVELIRGAKGTTVTFTILHQGDKDPVKIPVVRDTIDIPTIDTKTLPGGVFDIELYNFSAVSANQFRSALRQFVASGSHKLILDLRGNPGGYLDAAIDMASWFLPSGTTVVREDFGGKQDEQVYKSKGYDIFNNQLKMAILVDGGSASASEILAGALSENGVAKLVGQQTFGKGSVQELVKITPDTSLKVTVARWLTPNGISISHNGLTPDYAVPLTADDVAAGRDPQLDKALEILNQ